MDFCSAGYFIESCHTVCVKFECVPECAQCCIEREYYPSRPFGKIGVLLLPSEKERIERLARAAKVNLTILPRIGVSDTADPKSISVLAYQLMGREEDGSTCPFLDTGGAVLSPHGGLSCRIYDDRPLACAAYPLIGHSPARLDSKCRFCKECGHADQNLKSEEEALLQIQGTVRSDAPYVWRFATGVGGEDAVCMPPGWILEGQARPTRGL